MIFRRYLNMKAFADDNLALILEKEWLNNLIVGNIEDGLEKGTEEWEDFLLARIENKDKQVELIILLRRPWNMVMYSPTNNKSEELYKYAAQECARIYKDVPGINTDSEVASVFANEYCKLVNKKPVLNMPMRILLLEHLNTPMLRDDVLYRKAEIKDKDILKQFIYEFHVEALNQDISDEDVEKDFEKHFQRGDGYFVLEKDGKIVAQTVSSRKLKKGKCVSGVYTAKEERGQGYAYNLVYRVSKEYLDNGAEYCVLFTDDKNPISNHVYEKIGYKRMLDLESIDFV